MNKITSVILRDRQPFCLYFNHVLHKRNLYFLSPSTAISTSYTKEIHNKQVLTFERKMRFFANIKTKVNNFISDNTKAKVGGCLAFEKIGDNIDYTEFLRHFELPDTFQAWFLAVSLHVWMIISATLSDPKSKLFKISLVDSMWNDVEHRMEQLAQMKSSTRKKCLKELVNEFKAVLISYDEGILSDDTVLAATAWRMLFACKSVHPQLLEDAVLYIRKQLAHIESQSVQDIVYRGSVSFLPLKSIYSDKEL